MNTRAVVRVAASLARNAFLERTPTVMIMPSRLGHGHGPPAGYKPPTMDEMVVPCGSWKEHYDNNQRKYNIHLFLGVGVFVITLVTGMYSGAFNLYLFIPRVPADRESLNQN